MENNELKLGKGLMHHIRESNKPRDSRGRYCKRKTTSEITLKEFKEMLSVFDKPQTTYINQYPGYILLHMNDTQFKSIYQTNIQVVCGLDIANQIQERAKKLNLI